MTSDSTAPVAVRVEPEAVRSEVAQLFGRPADGSAASATFDIEVGRYASHERVQYWLSYFSTRARRHFEVYLARAGRYDSMIRTRLAAAGLPQDLIFLAMIESGFNQHARSWAGAVGLWQFIPGTARMYGMAVDNWVDDRRDPFIATDAAIRFLTDLNNRFGSLYLAAAAYNSGPGNIQRGLARHDFGALNGDDVYFALSEGTFLRRETRDYVPKLIAAALISKDPRRWGFGDIEHWTTLSYDSLPIDFAVGLDVVARLAGVPREAIEEINPRFYRGITPPDREVWLKVPVGSRDSMIARLDRLPRTQRVTGITHTVARGETLSRIARRYGVSITTLRTANRMTGSALRRGQQLFVPTSMVREPNVIPATPSRSAGRSTSRTVTRTVARTATTAPRAATSRRVHIVRRGESPWSISQDFGVSVDALLAANGLGRRSKIRAGQTLRIPTS